MTADTASTSGAYTVVYRIVLGVILIAAIIFLYRLLPVSEWIDTFQTFIRGYGVLGWFIFALTYALICFVLIPGSLLTLAAGVIWGFGGFPIVVIGATLGSAFSFLAARYLFQSRVQRAIENYPKFGAVNDAIGDEGWRVVFLLRLSPALPFSLQNWFLGVTPVGFTSSQLATFFGIMPGTLAYVWLGSLGGRVGSDSTGLVEWLVLGLGLAATILVTILVTRRASAKLREYRNL